MIKKFIYLIGKRRAKIIVSKIMPLLQDCPRIIDIGAGTCNITEILIKNGKKVTPVDIQNISFVPKIKPIVYDGLKIPFPSKSFNAALLICVLHHTSNQTMLLKEAQRVASNKVIVIEHICKNKVQKFLNKILDTIIALDFKNPHIVKTHREWKSFFSDLGFKVECVLKYKSFFIFNHYVYELSPLPK